MNDYIIYYEYHGKQTAIVRASSYDKALKLFGMYFKYRTILKIEVLTPDEFTELGKLITSTNGGRAGVEYTNEVISKVRDLKALLSMTGGTRNGNQ